MNLERVQGAAAELRYLIDPSGPNLDRVADRALRGKYPHSGVRWVDQGYVSDQPGVLPTEPHPLLPLVAREKIVRKIVADFSQGTLYADRVAAHSDSEVLHGALVKSIIESGPLLKQRVYGVRQTVETRVGTVLDAYQLCGGSEGHPLARDGLLQLFQATLPGRILDSQSNSEVLITGINVHALRARERMLSVFLHTHDDEMLHAADGYLEEHGDTNSARLALMQTLATPFDPSADLTNVERYVDKAFGAQPDMAEALKRHARSYGETGDTQDYVRALTLLSHDIQLNGSAQGHDASRWFSERFEPYIDVFSYNRQKAVRFLADCISHCPIEGEVGKEESQQHGLTYLMQTVADGKDVDVVKAAANRLMTGLAAHSDLQTDPTKTDTYRRVIMHLVRSALPDSREALLARFNTTYPAYITSIATEETLSEMIKILHQHGFPLSATQEDRAEWEKRKSTYKAFLREQSRSPLWPNLAAVDELLDTIST